MSNKPYGLKVNIIITCIAIALELTLYIIHALQSKNVYDVVMIFVVIWIAIAVAHYIGNVTKT